MVGWSMVQKDSRPFRADNERQKMQERVTKRDRK